MSIVYCLSVCVFSILHASKMLHANFQAKLPSTKYKQANDNKNTHKTQSKTNKKLRQREQGKRMEYLPMFCLSEGETTTAKKRTIPQL